MTLDAYIAGLPKAELHLHIEGSLEPELMFELARRNGVAIPFDSVEAVRAAYDFSNLQDFLDIYYAGANVLLEARDFEDLAFAYFQRAAADNVRHAEIFFDPQTHTDRGVPFGVVVEGLVAGMERAKAELGVTSGLILSFLRHLSEEEAFATLETARPYLHHFIGVGLDSSEVGHPPSKFQRVFAAARDLGLKLCAHAGEEGPPAYVREALDLLHIDRMDHGNRSMEDEALIERLAAERMTLTVCPLSNLKLCVVKDLKDHPVPEMLRRGLHVTLNSDDPAYFGGYVNENYRRLAAAVGLTRDQVTALARNSFEGSFLSEAEKSARIADVDAYDAATLDLRPESGPRSPRSRGRDRATDRTRGRRRNRPGNAQANGPRRLRTLESRRQARRRSKAAGFISWPPESLRLQDSGGARTAELPLQHATAKV